MTRVSFMWRAFLKPWNSHAFFSASHGSRHTMVTELEDESWRSCLQSLRSPSCLYQQGPMLRYSMGFPITLWELTNSFKTGWNSTAFHFLWSLLAAVEEMVSPAQSWVPCYNLSNPRVTVVVEATTSAHPRAFQPTRGEKHFKSSKTVLQRKPQITQVSVLCDRL